MAEPRSGCGRAAELGRIKALFDQHPGLAGEVGLVLAAARLGLGKRIAGSGAYVCGSLKEEFGLAIVEAMAAGLPAVAPRDGGPATVRQARFHGGPRRHVGRCRRGCRRARGARAGAFARNGGTGTGDGGIALHA